MRNDATRLLKEQLECVRHPIEACELMMSECTEDPDTCRAMSSVQAKYEATADEIETLR